MSSLWSLCTCDIVHLCTYGIVTVFTRDAPGMKSLSIINQKGGAGKTTLALHLAVAWNMVNRNKAVLDLDPQASATKWSDRRDSELPVALSAHASRLDHEMKRIKQMGGEVLVLDTAPRLDSAALKAAKVSDLVIVPCRPAIFDLEAVTNTLDPVRTTENQQS